MKKHKSKGKINFCNSDRESPYQKFNMYSNINVKPLVEYDNK